MRIVGCAGFPVPATRYFKEFLFVEIQETNLAIPGPGSLRRWKREAQPGFRFALLGPREASQEHFRMTDAVRTAVAGLKEVSGELGTDMVVFTSPIELASNKASKAQVKEFLEAAKKLYGRVVWEAPSEWDADDAAALAVDAGVTVARDAYAHGAVKGDFAYYRLPGPAGHKSRYEEPAIEKIAKVAETAKHKEAFYVFANVDMFTDAKRFEKRLGV